MPRKRTKAINIFDKPLESESFTWENFVANGYYKDMTELIGGVKKVTVFEQYQERIKSGNYTKVFPGYH